MSKIHVFGDSHCRWPPLAINKQIVSHWLPGRLLYSIAEDKHKGLPDLKASGVLPYDIVVFVFGEIDIRCHIYVQAKKQGKDPREILHGLVDKYEKTLRSKQDENIWFVIQSIVPPIDDVDAKRLTTIEYPIEGTSQERVEYTQYTNSLLQQMCVRQNWFFLNVYEAYATETGTLNPLLSDGNVHIQDYSNLEKALKNFLESLKTK